MDRERNEDLNPHGDDIEEKVRRMLDPNVPDEAEPTASKTGVPIAKVAAKVEAKDKPSPSMPPSAPALPTKPAKAVTIAVTHHDDVPAAAAETPLEVPKVVPEAVPKAAPKTLPVKKITISEHDESPADVAQKLDEAIAELDTPKPKKAAPKVAPKKAAPKRNEAVEEGDSNKVKPSPEHASEPDQILTAPPVAKAVAVKAATEEAAPKADDTEPAVATKAETLSVEPQDEPPLTIGDAIDKSALEIKDPAVLKDPETDKAVDDIIASESDEILEIEDAVRETDTPVKPTKPIQAPKSEPQTNKPTKPSKPKKHRGGLRALFKNKVFRWLLILLILGGLFAALGTPRSRYLILNTVGVRAQSSLTVLDDSTQQPLKDVQVSIGDVTGMTNDSGEVTLKNVKLGTNMLTIQKHAFAPETKNIVIGWGSNPLPSFGLTPTGTQYEFTAVDYLSGKPLAKVQASTREADASSNEQGIIKLTLDKPTNEELKVTFKLDGYRDEVQTLNLNDTSNHTIKLVPAKKQLFVSKRSGKYDVSSIYVDGKDEKVVLAGSGSERDDMVLVPHATEPVAAYVSTRSNQHNSQGLLLSDLTIINTDDNTSNTVVAAERIQVVDWIGDYLVYVQVSSGESANSPTRYRLMSYNLKTTATKELAKSNYFNDVVSVGGEVYYAPSSAYQNSKTALYKIKADGSGGQTVLNQEVWNIIRTNYDHLALAVEQQWYDHRVGDKAPTKVNAAPSSQEPRIYIDSPNGKQSAWVDVRDGKGVLLACDTSTKTDTVLSTQNGLTYPVRWLSDTVLVYRVKTGQETADYAVSTNGGEAVKIRDVTNAGGIDRWYYY